jgi:uncharacterized cupredoxin-like copper-binding protein
MLRWATMAVVALASCTAHPQAPAGPVIAVTLRDFSIHASTATVQAGHVLFDVENQGPASHEFIVVRTNLPAGRLPISSDGLTVNEDALDGVGQISHILIGDTETLDLNLVPGRYVFFCNVEGHYLGGMHGTIVVTSGG